jgi:tRNA(Arg) A34 adenosine deaminase TadA
MSNTYNPEIMQKCIDHARTKMARGQGGPFGAAVVKDGHVIVITSNSVLADNDPTAHAEINAIREACKALDTYDLSGCELYATGSPCPMCLSAIIWANIKVVYVGGEVKDAEAIGFCDQFIYDFLENGHAGFGDDTIVDLILCGEASRRAVKAMYDEYAAMNSTIY